MNSAANNLIFEINTANVLCRNIAVQRIPYVSCRVSGTVVGNSRGQITPTSSSPQAGQINVVMNPARPAGANFTPQFFLISKLGYIYADPPISGGVLSVYTHIVAGTATNSGFYLTIF